MGFEAGDDLDCPRCGERHEVRLSGTVRVKGFARRVPGTLYVDCPTAGTLVLDDEDGIEPGEDEVGTDEDEVWATSDDAERRDWP